MLKGCTLFESYDKVADAIKLLRENEPPEGYYVCFSGGKDSVVVLDLVKKAGVQYKAYHNIVTIEPPELMKFIYKEYPEVIMVHPEKTMYQLIKENGIPPLRQFRYCHRLLKGAYGLKDFKVTGIRAEESPRRAKRKKLEDDRTDGRFLHLIHDWTKDDVWTYIKENNISYCRLYDEGKDRIGCLFCPFGKKSQMEDDLRRYPQVARYLITACQAAIDIRKGTEREIKNFETGEQMFYWWINHDKSKPPKDRNLPSIFE